MGSKEIDGRRVLEPNAAKTVLVGLKVLVVGPAYVGIDVGSSPFGKLVGL